MAIAHVLYRSRATVPPTAPFLHALLDGARTRNEAEDLTGVLVVDGRRFVQWIEGPRPALERVWRSIRRDPRHRDIESLTVTWDGGRLFPDWRMQLATGEAMAELTQTVWLDPVQRREVHAGAQAAEDCIYALALRRRLPPLGRLLECLTADDELPWLEATEQVAVWTPSLRAAALALFGPLSRALAAAWMRDRLTAQDIVIAQARLRQLLRQVAGHAHAGGPVDRRVLVATAPGEADVFGVAFAATAMDLHGWDVQCLFPRTVDELLRVLRRTAFDALHLASSECFRREDRLADIAATVRAAHRASCHPRMLVLLGGRAFVEQPGLAVLLGADGEGLDQGTRADELPSMVEHVRRLGRSPAAMIAQATIADVALKVHGRVYGIPERHTADGR